MPSSTLLVVASDGVLVANLCDGLRRRGWVVSVAGDIRSAIDLAIAHQPQAIIAQTRLPGASGFNFVRALRAAVEHDVRVVGIATTPEASDEARGRFDLLVEVPVDLDFLHRVLDSTDDELEARKPTIKLRPLKP